MSKFQTTAFLSAILVTITYSDIAPNPIFSESIQAFNETQVQMVSELVTADLYKGYSEVRIEFTMKNHGDDTTLEVGFPNTPNWRENDALTNFTVSVEFSCKYVSNDIFLGKKNLYNIVECEG